MKLYMSKRMPVVAAQWYPGDNVPGVIQLDQLTATDVSMIKSSFLPRYGGTADARGAIQTNNGFIAVVPGDFVVANVATGAYHATPPDIFNRLYEPATVEADRLAWPKGVENDPQFQELAAKVRESVKDSWPGERPSEPSKS
jgi:hypothetical protein